MKNRLSIELVALILVLFGGCTKSAQTAGGFDWPMWRGPDGNGQSRETEWDPAAIANPKILWKADVGMGYSNVAIQGGRLYTVGLLAKSGFTVSCLDAATGRKIWQRPFPSTGYPQATPTADGDSLFILTAEGALHAIETKTGKQRWRKDLVADYGAVKPFYGFAGSPMVTGDLVVLTANTAGMAVKRDTGELAWISEKPPAEFRTIYLGSFDPSGNLKSTGTAYATPVLYEKDGRSLAILSSWRGITSVDVLTGEPVRRYDWETEPHYIIPDPVIDGDRVCVTNSVLHSSTFSGSLLRMTDTGVTLVWRTTDMFTWGTAPLIIDGYIYLAHFGMFIPIYQQVPTSLRCIDIETGQVKWSESLGPNRSDKSIALASANGILIVLDELGTLSTARASPEGFKVIASCDVLQGEKKPRVFWTPPVLCNARIYCRNFGGDLVCIDVSR